MADKKYSPRRTNRTAKPSRIYKDYINNSSGVRKSFGPKSRFEGGENTMENAVCAFTGFESSTEEDASVHKTSTSIFTNLEISSEREMKDTAEWVENSEKKDEEEVNISSPEEVLFLVKIAH